MVTAEQIRQMPRDEKLRVMEMIWSDLTSGREEIESPDWHAEALRETEARVASGAETPIDWSTAKEQLRSERK